jgi:NtrC-family two-component system response regulator AlgB
MKVLLVEDEKLITATLTGALEDSGHEVRVCHDGKSAFEALDDSAFDVVISDVRLPKMDGFSLFEHIKQRQPGAFVIFITAYANVQDAVKMIKAGAYDYLAKPFALDEVGLLLDRVLEVQRLRRENRALRQASVAPMLLESSNPAMRRVLEIARQAAPSDVTVLLTGESGTGKNVLAAAIHGWSRRSRGPFVAIACTTLAEHLVESELFGHMKGAFTGAWKDKPGRLEAADGGTVLLDEVGELSPELQGKLLRFLEERRFERLGSDRTLTVDVRVIAATNRDLESEVRAGRFREDLFFRLNVVALRLPALRERAEDLESLIDLLLERLAVRHARPGLELDPEARRALVAYPWPGNVRELVNALERAVVLARTDRIARDELPDAVTAPETAAADDDGSLSIDAAERRLVERALAESATLEEAAARLGINPTTLWRKRKRWKLD